ncbi:beta-propeller fold lactonase family protein [Pseudomonas gozinkensis]|uniref:beta-propeller fold lactonase family protein n=1 Tax=Pseudomonas gozinkensis TaxID=2774461 RepID=UPI001787C054|nr:YncE family protein [Pseudomonas gozinkensis]
MSTQNPFFSFFSTFPGGTPLKNPDITQSKDIEMGADGPPGDPLEITDTHNGVIKVLTPPGSVFNTSGRYLHRVQNMLDGAHTFGLRANSSSTPFHQWVLTVGAAETLTIEMIKGLISGKEIPEGSSTSETLFAMSGKARANATCYLRIDGVRQQGLIAVDGSRNWTYNTGTQTPGLHSYAVEGNYDSGPVSAPPRTLRIGLSATIPVGKEPVGSVAHPNGSHVYVCNTKGSSVSVIDAGNQTVINTIRLAQDPSGITIHPNGLFLYVYGALASTVWVINTQSQTVTATIKVGVTPNGIAIHPNGTRVYVCSATYRSVTVIDTQNLTVIKTIDNLPGSLRIAINPNGSYLYVTQAGFRTVSVIDTRSQTVIKTVNAGQWPFEIAANPSGSHVFVTDKESGTVSVIETQSHTVIKAISVGQHPSKLAFHPDGSRAYVCLYLDNLVAVIDTQSQAVIKTDSVGQGPGAITVLPDGTLLYVSNAASSTVSVIPAK